MSDTATSYDFYALIGFVCEAVCWGTLGHELGFAFCLLSTSVVGAYTTIFSTCLIVLFRRWREGRLNIPIAATGCILFGACTAHFASEFNHFVTAMVSPSLNKLQNRLR